MNLYLQRSKFRGCVKHCGEEIICGERPLLAEPRFFCSNGPASSSTAQTSENYQVGAQSAPGGPSIGIGAGSTTGAINTTTSDSGNSVNQTNSNNTTVSGDVLTSNNALLLANNVVTSNNALSGQALVAADDMATHSEDIVGGIATSAITTGAQTAQSLGGAAINLGNNATLAAFQFAQNQSVLNYNALNQNTALAFSTINALDTSQAAGAVSAAAQDTLAAVTAAAATPASTSVIYEPSATQPYTGTAATGSGIDSTTLLLIAGIAVVAIYLFKK
jgi:hypothetical protein